jgi:hypothetical protein
MKQTLATAKIVTADSTILDGVIHIGQRITVKDLITIQHKIIIWG